MPSHIYIYIYILEILASCAKPSYTATGIAKKDEAAIYNPTSVLPTATPIPLGIRDASILALKTLSENSVQVSWTKPTGSIDHYEIYASTSKTLEPDFTQPPIAIVSDSSTTQTTVTGITAGSLGKLRVRARVSDNIKANDTGTSVSYWTPYGAFNAPNVSSYVPLGGTPGGPYVEGLAVSANFTMMFSHAFVPEASYIFTKIPSGVERPIYNWAGKTVKYNNGFDLDYIHDYTQIWTDGISKVAVAQWGQNRVWLYDSLPTSPEKRNPSRLLGQTSWTSTAFNAGSGSVNNVGFSYVTGVCFNGSTLYVADNQNHRILGWNGWPTQMGQPADFIIGQPTASANICNNGGRSKSSLCFPYNLSCSNGKLAVTDYVPAYGGNNRILIWNSAPTSNVAADIVIGQVDGTTAAIPGAGGTSLGGFGGVYSVTLVPNGSQTAVVASDYANHRVLQWNDIPAVDGAPFDLVYGQASAAGTAANGGGSISLSGFNGPSEVTTEVGSNKFWVADFMNSRWLRFQLGNTTAIGQYGQPDGVTNSQSYGGNNSGGQCGWSRWASMGLYLDSNSGIFSSCGKVWTTAPSDGNTLPTTGNDVGAAVKLGTRNYWIRNTNSVFSSTAAFSAGANTPDIILGNKDASGTVVAPVTFDYAITPSDIVAGTLANGQKVLYLADGPRVVGYATNTSLTTSNQPIDFALGQPDLVTRTANTGGVTASSISAVGQITIIGTKLVVVDSGNNRVLVWNSLPSTTGVAADVVIGQADFTSAAAGISLSGLSAPSGVTSLNGKLLVSDVTNNRIVIFNSIPTSNGTAANSSWDPRTATFGLPSWYNYDTLAAGRLASYQGRLYIQQVDRITIVPDFFQ